jgi:7-cyano-7-deazaguanine synthase
MGKVVVAFSGGMDSTTVLAEALSLGHEAIPVGFQYPTKHNHWEREMAQKAQHNFWLDPENSIGDFYVIDLTSVFDCFKSNLLKSGDDIPEGHYEAENMKLTIVPGRNIIFASILAGYAWSIGAEEVWLGIHAGDHFIYPDCRPEFHDAMNDAINCGTDGEVELRAPFLTVTKKEILQRGLELKVNYKLTRTCYKDQAIACGKCGSCQERLSAFASLGIEDPLDYESRMLTPKHS